jgi:hypothetical protein
VVTYALTDYANSLWVTAVYKASQRLHQVWMPSLAPSKGLS